MASGKTLQSTIEISGVLSPSLQAAIKNAVDKLEDMSKETLESAGAAEKLCAEISTQESVLKSLKKGYANYVAGGKESSDEAEKLADKIQELSTELAQNKRKLEDAEDAANDLDVSFEDAGKSAEDASGGFTIMKGALADLVADGISAAVDAFKDLSTEGDTALAMLEAKTGATGDKMAGFEDVMYEVYNANYGENLGAVQEAMSTIIQMTDDLDNASLAKVTKSAIALEDVFGFDVKESMRAVNSLMDQFGITSDQAFNLIVQGAQNGLNQNDDLLDTINEYSVQFKSAGYTADDMFNMLTNGVESGTWSVDKLGDAVKEMNIRLSDGTADEALAKLGLGIEEASVDAEALGKAALSVSKAESNLTTAQWEANDALKNYGADSNKYKKALNKLTEAEYSLADAQEKYNEIQSNTEVNLDGIKERLAAGGETAQTAMNEIMAALMNVEDEQERYMLGQTIMGTMWEDLGEDTVAALMNTQGAINGTTDAMAQMDGAAYGTLESSLSQLGRTIKAEVLQPIADELTPVIKDAVNFATNNVTPAVDWFLNNLPTMAVLIGGITAAIAAFKIAALSAKLATEGFTIATKLQSIAQGALNAVMNANPIGLIIIAVTALVAAFVYLWNNCEGFRNFWIGLWDGIKKAVSVAVDWIKDCWEKIKAFFTGDNPIATYFQTAWANIKIVWDVVVSYFKTIWDNIKLVFSAVKSVFKGDFSGAWEAVKQIFVNWGEFFAGLWDSVKAIFANIGGWFGETFGGVWEKIKEKFAKVGEFFAGIWDKIVSVFTSIGTAVSDAISGAVKGAINSVLSGAVGIINGFIKAINFAIDIINAIPGVEISTLQLLEVPQFASGGFTNGVSIAGEAGTEAVISFDPAYHDKNVGIWERAGQMLGTLGNSTTGEPSGEGLTSKAGELLTLDNFSLGSLADGTSVVIYYDFSGFTWSPQIHADGAGDNEDDLMARLKAHEAEFFEWLEEFIKMREVAQYA